MTFKPVLVNRDIPHTMTVEGLKYLGRMARTVPQNGTIVEVGPLFGSSTWVLAKNAHPSVKVISIDTWEPAPWIDEIEKKFPGCRKFSKETFLHHVKDCPNVTAIQGWSPQVMGDWNQPIDLFFDDATHGDPGFTESLNFYLPKLREGGIACGDDYASGWPDIVRGVSKLSGEWQTFPEIIGRVWSMVKPMAGQKPPSIYERAGAFSENDLVTTVRTQDGRTFTCSPGVWAGLLHNDVPVTGIKLDWVRSDPDLDIVIQALGTSGARTGYLKSGEWAELNQPFRSIRAHLIGKRSADLQLAYQGCHVTHAGKKPKFANSVGTKDGRWISAPDQKSYLCAFRTYISATAASEAAAVDADIARGEA
jgi:hypothetical protein